MPRQSARSRVLEDALVGIDGAGRIASVLRAEDPGHSVALGEADAKGCLIRLPRTCFMLPGFVDLHIHAPQYPQLGTALHVPLEVWLQTHTFPLEARYADLAFAERHTRRSSAIFWHSARRRRCFSPRSTRRRRDSLSISASQRACARSSARWRWTTRRAARTIIGMPPPALRSKGRWRSSNMCADTPQTATVLCFPPSRRASSRAAPISCWKGWARSRKAQAAMSRRIARRATGSMARCSPATAAPMRKASTALG